MTIEVRCNITPWRSTIELCVIQRRGEITFLARPPELVRIEMGEIIPEPTLGLDITAGQQLMDELWRCGLRPSEGSGSAGALAATERHLHDMQRLVFGDGKPLQFGKGPKP